MWCTHVCAPVLTLPRAQSQRALHSIGRVLSLTDLASWGCLVPWPQQLQQEEAPAANPAPSPQNSSLCPGSWGWHQDGLGADKSDGGSPPPASVKQDQVFSHLATCFINLNLYLSLLLFFQGLFMVQSCRQCCSFLHSLPPSYLWQSVALERSNLREEIH